MRAYSVALAVTIALVGASLQVARAAAPYSSIVQALKDNDMKMFLEASDKTGFTPQLQSPGFIGTVFAPTDDAFQAALDTAGVSKKQLFDNNTLLVDVIMYHVVPGDAISSDRLRNDGRYTSMRGKSLTITKSLGGDVAVNSGSTATVVDKDLKAGAAIFNVVDNMLLPPDELASLNLRQADTVRFYTTLEEAFGYDEQLTTLSQAFYDTNLTSLVSNPGTTATLFAPIDDAWYTIEQMSNYYAGNASAITGNKKALTNLLKYHIVDGRAIRASQLKDKMTLTMSNGETVMVHVTNKPARKVAAEIEKDRPVVAARISGVDPSMHIVLSPNSDGDEAQLVSADVIAGRSYLHKVDAVLIPKSTLAYLEKFTADAGKKKKGNVTVAEALKNATAANLTTKGLAKNGTSGGRNGTDGGRNATRAASGAAAQLVATAALAAPLLLVALFA